MQVSGWRAIDCGIFDMACSIPALSKLVDCGQLRANPRWLFCFFCLCRCSFAMFFACCVGLVCYIHYIHVYGMAPLCVHLLVRRVFTGRLISFYNIAVAAQAASEYAAFISSRMIIGPARYVAADSTTTVLMAPIVSFQWVLTVLIRGSILGRLRSSNHWCLSGIPCDFSSNIEPCGPDMW